MNFYLKNIIYITFLTVSICEVNAQNIYLRNDSLFINDTYINEEITKDGLDIILGNKGKIKTSKVKYTSEKEKKTTWYYHDLGLFFRKYENKPNRLHVGIKLYEELDPKMDKSRSELKFVFKGKLYIGEDYMNDKRTFEQLQNLESSTFNISTMLFGSYSQILGGELIYEGQQIRISFDKETSEMTTLHIHHNLKN